MRSLASLFVVVLAGSIFAASVQADINLGPEEILKAKGQEIVVPGYSVPSFEDWNNDKLSDLIVGEGGNGYVGKVRVYPNVGTVTDPCFVDYFYAKSNGSDLTCTPDGCQGCFPRLVYWNDDKKKDLLVGLADGTVQIFLNIGSDNEPAFDGGTLVKVGDEDAYTLDVGKRATPSLLDWNNDGMLDIVTGALDGMIHVYYNCGCGGSVPPHFYTSPVLGSMVQANGDSLLVPVGRSCPAIFDVDGDGKKDIITGNTEGQILFYKNVSALDTDQWPTFAGYSPVLSSGQPIDLPNGPSGGLRSRPAVCHWTGANDGYWDLLVGYGDGKIRLYRGIPKMGDFNGNGTLDGDDFTLLVQALDIPLAAGTTSPVDLNKDGKVDNLDLRLFADLWLLEHGVEKQ